MRNEEASAAKEAAQQDSPFDGAPAVELRPIGEDNFEQCIRLKASVEKERFADPVLYSLAEAWVFYQDTRPFAIYRNDKMIGFVSMYVGEENHQIINFLIDGAFQRKGFGTAAAKACVCFLREGFGAKRISVPVDRENIAAQRFWERLGFRFSDTVEDGYIFMRLE